MNLCRHDDDVKFPNTFGAQELYTEATFYTIWFIQNLTLLGKFNRALEYFLSLDFLRKPLQVGEINFLFIKGPKKGSFFEI